MSPMIKKNGCQKYQKYTYGRSTQEAQLAHLKHSQLTHAFEYYISLALQNLWKHVTLTKMSGIRNLSKNI